MTQALPPRVEPLVPASTRSVFWSAVLGGGLRRRAARSRRRLVLRSRGTASVAAPALTCTGAARRWTGEREHAVRAAAWRSGWAPGAAPAEPPPTPCAGADGYVQATTCQSWSRSRARPHPLRWRRGTPRVDALRAPHAASEVSPRHEPRAARGEQGSSPCGTAPDDVVVGVYVDGVLDGSPEGRDLRAQRPQDGDEHTSARALGLGRELAGGAAQRRMIASPVDVSHRSARALRLRAEGGADVRTVARQRGACRGASEADGAGPATVTRMGRLWPARTRQRPRKAPVVVRRARRPAPIRFARPRRAPRVRVLPAPTRGGTTRGPRHRRRRSLVQVLRTEGPGGPVHFRHGLRSLSTHRPGPRLLERCTKLAP